MHQPKKWWIGLPILIAIAYFAGANLTPLIEADIEARAMTRLAKDSSAPGSPKISVVGRDVTISGLSQEAASRALADLRLEPGLRRLATPGGDTPPVQTAALGKGAEVAPPHAASYSFSISLGDSVIGLTGQLPSEAMRKEVVAKVAALRTSAAVSDATKIDAGAQSGDYARVVDFALSSLGKLTLGKITISDGRVSIEGQGRENIQAATIEADAKAKLPQGFALVKADIAPGAMSPYVFTAAREGGQLTLTGYAPDESTRKRIIEAARKRFFDATVNDRLVVAKGAPTGFADAVEASFSALARLAEGRLAIKGGDLSLAGVARHQTARADIEHGLNDSLPPGFKSDLQLRANSEASLPADQCRAALVALASKPVVFSADDLSVAADSAPLMDAIVATAMRCQNVAIEIGAYTDNAGIEEINLARSKRRANTVLETLVKSGVEPMKLTAVGYGSQRPVAQNDSEENRARNRRVEFTVK